MDRIKTIMLVWLMLLTLAAPAEASVFSDALAKARSVMQSAFQLSFLHKLPVVFYKESFDRMFEHTNRSIDEMNLKYGDRTITRDQFQDDKALHIKKSAELALHIKSLVGSAHLAYGITMVVGLIKEAIDGSFLNPGGSRSKEDVIADHIGARAVFGEEKFNESLNKHLGKLIKPEPAAPMNGQSGESAAFAGDQSTSSQAVEQQTNPFSQQGSQIGGTSSAAARQQLIKRYYEAVEKGDTAAARSISAELKALP